MRDHRKEKVTLGVVHGGHPEMDWVFSVVANFWHDAYKGNRRFDHPVPMLVQAGSNVAAQRNSVVRLFLESSTADWLLFWDDDEPAPPDVVERLVRSADPDDRPILSGLVMAEKKSPHYRIVPACVGFESLDPLVPREYDTIPPEQHWRVGAAGAGALLVHRRVLEAIGEKFASDAFPWFKFMQAEILGQPDVIGEDYGFCLRAASLGVPTHVDTTIELGHVKRRTLRTADFWATQPRESVLPKTFVCIPTKGKAPKYLKGLLRDLWAQGDADDIFVMDNGCTGDIARWLRDHDDQITLVSMEDTGIHEMWNRAVDLASGKWPRYRLAFLNDDIKIGPNFLAGLSLALEDDPMCAAVCPNHDGRKSVTVQPLSGINAAGKNPMGLAGWAFMVRSEWFDTGFRFPEECRWWFGDNFLTVAIDLAGGWYGLVPDVTVEHLGGATGDWDAPEIQPQLAADQEAFVRACKEIGVEVTVQ